MAKGWDDVEQTAQAQAEHRAQMDARRKPMLKVNARNPGPVTLRFLAQGPDVDSYYVHEYKVPNPKGGQPFSRNFSCFSQAPWNLPECPGCRAGMSRKIRSIHNIIQRQRPVWRVGADNRVIYNNGEPIVDGYEDTVVIADVGSLTSDMLRQADGNYRGLMTRDFVVTFSGNTFQSWTLSPAIDSAGNANATPLSPEDLALAAQRYDLDEYMKPPSMQEAAQIIVRFVQNHPGQQAQGGSGQGGQQGQPANPMLAGVQVPPGTNVLGAVTGAMGAGLGS